MPAITEQQFKKILSDGNFSGVYMIYGDEKYADYVMGNNPTLIATTIFSAGTLIWIPDLPPDETDELPEWRK